METAGPHRGRAISNTVAGQRATLQTNKRIKMVKITLRSVPLVIFMRHGQAESNVARILAGRHMESHLTADGRQQVMDSSKQLMKNIAIEKVYVSPVIRTVETAQIALSDTWYRICY